MSRITVFPPVATIYPNDRQLFTAQSEKEPPLWVSVTDSGDIKSDFSLEVDPAGSQVGGFGGHLLQGGIGSVEITIDDQCLPNGASNFIDIVGFINDINNFQYQYRVVLRASSMEIRDEADVQLFTESHTLASGEKYKLELAAGFRLYRNGALLHSRVGLPTAVIYPQRYSCSISETTVATPTRIPGPKLIGKWELSPFISWTAPSHGSISAVGLAIATEYFGGTVPGEYILTAAMEPSADATGAQQATAKITIPPLEPLGPGQVTAKPGEKLRLKTNYDKAQSRLIEWSSISGGSFTQDEYTAPTVAGTFVVRATADVNDQVADIKIIVPPVISNASNYTAAKPGEQIDFEHNLPLTPLFAGLGAVTSGTGVLTAGLPSSLQFNDVLLLIAETANQGISTPTDWTLLPDGLQTIGTAGDAAATGLFAWARRVVGPVPAPTISDSGDHQIAQILAFRGCVPTGNPWDVTAGNTGSASTSISIPGDTTTVPNCLVVVAVAHGIDTTSPQVSGFTNADLANLTELTDVATDAGNGGGFAVAAGEKATAGAYGATTATLGSAFAQGRMSVALKSSLTWSASVGSINSSTGVWTAPSLAGQIAKITVTNGTITKTIEIPVLEVFPISRFATPMEGSRAKKIVFSEAEDGTDFSRVKDKDGKARDSYSLQIKSLTLAEYDSIKAFWDDHHPGKLFILEDTPRQIRLVVKFDSDLVWRVSGSRFEVSFRVREAGAFSS